MGQKINPNIFRLGVNKTWKTEFFEKKRSELPLYTFKDLEIKNYIEQFLEIQGIFLHDYKQHHSDSTINLYISYFVSSDYLLSKSNKSDRLLLVDKLKNKKVVSDAQCLARKYVLNTDDNFFQDQNASKAYVLRNYSKNHLNFLSNVNLSEKEFNATIIKLKVEGAIQNLLKVISLFTNHRLNTIIHFSCINKDLNFFRKTQKKNFILLRKFRNTPFLKDGAELLFCVTHSKASAALLAKFIAAQIKKAKRQKFFISFLKQALTILIESSLSTVKGIKILVKGRLNGVPRANHKMIIIGDVPVQSLNHSLDYAQTSIHNSSGSYGIKVWIHEK